MHQALYGSNGNKNVDEMTKFRSKSNWVWTDS